MSFLQQSIGTLKGIGPRRAEALGRLGLFSMGDLLYYAPRNYENYTELRQSASCAQGEAAAIPVLFLSEPSVARPRKGLDILSVRAMDESGKLLLVWFNQSYRRNQLHAGDQCIACGRMDKRRGARLVNPGIYHVLPGIIPVYSLPKPLGQRVFRDLMHRALDEAAGELEETLPLYIREKYELCGLDYALKNIHFPESFEALGQAKRRLAFEDMLTFQLMLGLLERGQRGDKGIAFETGGLMERFLKKLPFPPTPAQVRAMEEISADMGKRRPMNRLLQGDVGSGKTVPALFAMFAAVENGYQAALLAPTEILAEQHYSLLKDMFGERACLLKGGMKKREREDILSAIASGQAMAITGTHALLQEDVGFLRLGMVIADEQHRFGVRQRAALRAKGEPDVLIMSATPIPRTLALLLYGDLDLSILDELPPGRKPIKTRFVPQEKREDMYRFIESEAKMGRQAYVVCPLVEQSEALEGLLSAESLYAELKKKLGVRLGLLHGRMRASEKSAITEAFRRGEIDILVSTTVIEVGVDVPNASVMVIENADRFGLAQLHQLRGRVGRGSAASYCFLLSESGGENARERLELLAKTQNGFIIAEKDLAMRGPGELLGARQHGMGEFGGMGLAADMNALNAAARAAKEIAGSAALQRDCAALIKKAEEKLRLRMAELVLN